MNSFLGCCVDVLVPTQRLDAVDTFLRSARVLTTFVRDQGWEDIPEEIPAPPEEGQLFLDTIHGGSLDRALHSYFQSWGWDHEVWEVQPEGVKLRFMDTDEECPTTPQLIADLVRGILHHSDSGQEIVVTWSRWADKHRTDAFYGGSFAVTRHAATPISEDPRRSFALRRLLQDTKTAKEQGSPYRAHTIHLTFLLDRGLKEGELLADLLEEADSGDALLLETHTHTETVSRARMYALTERAGSEWGFWSDEDPPELTTPVPNQVLSELRTPDLEPPRLFHLLYRNGSGTDLAPPRLFLSEESANRAAVALFHKNHPQRDPERTWCEADVLQEAELLGITVEPIEVEP